MSPEKPNPLVEELLRATTAPVIPKINTQVYGNNTLSSSGAEDYYKSENRLFGDKEPNLAIKCERPEHRLIVYLKARGMSNTEIAKQTGYGYQWVCQIVRQPWFRARFVQECTDAGQDVIKTFLTSEAMPSLETLAEIRDDEEQKGATRVTAANSILDRFLGKPIQHVETEKVSDSLDKAREDVEALERQVRALAAQNGMEADFSQS